MTGLRGSYANGFAPRDGRPLYPGLWRGCVGAWAPCLGPTGLRLQDNTDFGNHGTLTGMDPATDWVVSGGKYALKFSTNKYVLNATSTSFLGVSRYSVSCWAAGNSRGGGSFGRIWFSGSGASATDIIATGTNQLSWRMSSSQALAFAFNFDGTVRHIACVYDSGVRQSVYVNGVLVATRTPGATSADFNAGFRISDNSSWWDGHVLDVIAYTRVLTDNEISILSQRPGIAYEMAPRRRYNVQGAAPTTNRRRRILLGNR